MTTIRYLSLSKPERALVSIGRFFKGIGIGIAHFFKKIPSAMLKVGYAISKPFRTLFDAFKNGTWFTRLNFLFMGFSQLLHHEIFRGILYLAYEGVFIWFLIKIGISNLSKLGTLGTFSPTSQYIGDVAEGTLVSIAGDSSFTILLYSLVTILFIIILVVLWYFSIRDAKSLQDNIAIGKNSKNTDFLKELVDKKYHKLLLAIPLVGLVAFTVIPIIFMIIVGFTNYDGRAHADLFDWVGFDNYHNLFAGFTSNGSNIIGEVFWQVLGWTLLWALIATFTNYFLGMIVALLINKKGIKLKKLWRTILILTIAVPQFVSLLLINRMLTPGGFLTRLFVQWNWIPANTSPFDSVILARALIIIVNMWVGVPYTMLICSGILMNIPEDLYESARIDGASTFKMYTSITLPYMLFITLPYLISQFVGNINNFNIIYLLSAGAPKFKGNIPTFYGEVGQTDLLITWIYKMSMEGDDKSYAVACVLGILIFLVIAVISLIFYGRSSSVKNEEDFQ
ncbi:MAG: sugar ABC transporter permease [Bacilli bacterium]|nr:sugar ABC transporter permease [Bacilli bacterium]